MMQSFIDEPHEDINTFFIGIWEIFDAHDDLESCGKIDKDNIMK